MVFWKAAAPTSPPAVMSRAILVASRPSTLNASLLDFDPSVARIENSLTASPTLSMAYWPIADAPTKVSIMRTESMPIWPKNCAYSWDASITSPRSPWGTRCIEYIIRSNASAALSASPLVIHTPALRAASDTSMSKASASACACRVTPAISSTPAHLSSRIDEMTVETVLVTSDAESPQPFAYSAPAAIPAVLDSSWVRSSWTRILLMPAFMSSA